MECQRKKFSLPDDQIYLNGAYMSPLLNSVVLAGQEAIVKKQTPSVIRTDDFFSEVEVLKKSFAQLCSISNYQDVAIVPSASYGLATVAKNIHADRGQKIVLISEQFPSNVYSWQRLAEERGLEIQMIESPSSTSERSQGWNEKILAAVDHKTVLVAMGNVHWADGTKFDLMSIRKATRAVGALLVIDGTQSVGALPFDVQSIQPDALVCAGYKWLMGPYSIGLAYYGEYFREGQPLEENWINRLNSEDFKGLVNYEARYQPGMTRYDMGEKSNFILVPMMIKALEFILEITPEAIQNYCAGISEEALGQLRASGWSMDNRHERAHHLVGIRPPQHVSLEDCAVRLRENNIMVSVRGSSIRISPNVYNTHDEMMRLAEVLSA
jgi:selenocysteine lyase/cysteine desulfurase